MFIIVSSEPSIEIFFYPINSYQAPVMGQSQHKMVRMPSVYRSHGPCLQCWHEDSI